MFLELFFTFSVTFLQYTEYQRFVNVQQKLNILNR